MEWGTVGFTAAAWLDAEFDDDSATALLPGKKVLPASSAEPTTSAAIFDEKNLRFITHKVKQISAYNHHKSTPFAPKDTEDAPFLPTN
jgi:hypothetical protein